MYLHKWAVAAKRTINLRSIVSGRLDETVYKYCITIATLFFSADAFRNFETFEIYLQQKKILYNYKLPEFYSWTLITTELLYWILLIY